MLNTYVVIKANISIFTRKLYFRPLNAPNPSDFSNTYLQRQNQNKTKRSQSIPVVRESLNEKIHSTFMNMYIYNIRERSGLIIREFKKILRRRRRQRRLKTEFIFYLRISGYSKVIYFVYHCQTYHETESGAPQ